MPPKPPLRVAEQPLDALGHGVGRADQGRAHLHALAQRIVGAAGRAAERVLEIGHGLAALAGMDLAQRLLVVLGDVHVDHEAPLRAVGLVAVLGRRLLVDLPLLGQRLGPAGQAGADRQHAEAVLAGRDHARRRDGAGHRDGEMRIGVRREMQARLPQLEPVGLHRDRLLALQELHDGVERLVHAVALGRRARCPSCRRRTAARPGRSPAWRGRASCGRAARSGSPPSADGDTAGWSRPSPA